MNDQKPPQEHQSDNNNKLIKIEPEDNPKENQSDSNNAEYQYYYQQQVPRPKTNRSLLKYLLYNVLTFGIYDYICFYFISKDINTIARPHDHKKTINYLIVAFIISPLTFGIGYIVWFHLLSSRISKELNRRNLNYQFGAKDYWIWNVLFTTIPKVISTCYSIYTTISFVANFIFNKPFSVLSPETETIILIITYALNIVGLVGTCVYMNKLLKSMNLLSESYNYYG